MGHPGDAAILSAAKDAKKAGILVDFSNVPAPKSIAELNAGFTGANLSKMGAALSPASHLESTWSLSQGGDWFRPISE